MSLINNRIMAARNNSIESKEELFCKNYLTCHFHLSKNFNRPTSAGALPRYIWMTTIKLLLHNYAECHALVELQAHPYLHTQVNFYCGCVEVTGFSHTLFRFVHETHEMLPPPVGRCVYLKLFTRLQESSSSKL